MPSKTAFRETKMNQAAGVPAALFWREVAATSRCGVDCECCERRSPSKLQRLYADEKTFWGGECKVKSCCEAKGYFHCAHCADFPCEMQKNMGRAQGYDPAPRIARVYQWLLEEAEEKTIG